MQVLNKGMMNKDYNGIAAVITALSTIFLALITYIFKPMLDVYIEDWKVKRAKASKENNKRCNALKRKIYFRLSKILNDLDCDRIYILQPHPLNSNDFFSMTFELVNEERDLIKYNEIYQSLDASEWAIFIGRLSTENWIWFSDISSIKDNKWRNDLKRRGVQSVLYYRMVNAEGDWVGDVCLEFTFKKPSEISLTYMKDIIKKEAEVIPDILPEHKPKKQKK